MKNNGSYKNLFVFGALTLVWLLVCGWLTLERSRVDALAREAMLNRGRDITNTIAVLSRSGIQGFIWQSRLEDALRELTGSSELEAVALLNAQGETVASAGDIASLDLDQLPEQGTRWDGDRVTIVNLVEFGLMTQADNTTRPTPIILPAPDPDDFHRDRDHRPDGERSNDERPPEFESPPDDRPTSSPLEFEGRPPIDPRQEIDGPPGQPNEDRPPPEESRDEKRGENDRRHRFHRPFWMDRGHYEELLANRGLHGFVLTLSTSAMQTQLDRDLWMRLIVAVVALIAVLGLGVAWRGMMRSTRLQLRLIRFQELNDHLREMNLAAAGLAHETRNPLNIVRGMAQMIATHDQLPEAVAPQARRIAEEVDHVTQRLNEFIKFSRPIQPSPAPVRIDVVCREVFDTLRYDCEDKKLHTAVQGPALTVLADESHLRQAIFNLVLNAIQAAPENGRIVITAASAPHSEAVLMIEDDGPGVETGLTGKIFSPYFTTHEEGSGLGLAVVRQIVLAHHWEIDYQGSDMGGAGFRIAGIKIHAARDAN